MFLLNVVTLKVRNSGSFKPE